MANSNASDGLILNGDSFNPQTDMKYTKPKVNKSGGKAVGILNNGNTGLILNTPLILTWGVQENDFEGNGRKTYDMALQFPSDDYQTDATSAFLDNMKEFEKKIKADAIANRVEWFNKGKLTPEVVDALFSPMLKYPKNPDTKEPDESRSPTMRIKLDKWDGEFTCEIYDLEQKMLFPNSDEGITPMSLIPKAINVAVMIRCGGLWFANGKFGVTWKLVQACVKPKQSLKGRCLIQLSSDDKNKMMSQKDDEDDDETVENTVAAEDSSDDNDDDTVAEKEPEPVQEVTPEPAFTKKVESDKPKKVKKVVRRKPKEETA